MPADIQARILHRAQIINNVSGRITWIGFQKSNKVWIRLSHKILRHNLTTEYVHCYNRFIIPSCHESALFPAWKDLAESHLFDSNLKMDCACAAWMSPTIPRRVRMSFSFSRGPVTCCRYGERVGAG